MVIWGGWVVVMVVVVDSRPHQWAGWERWNGNIRCWEAEMVGGEMTQQIHWWRWVECSLVEGWSGCC